jgi:hypothetical protein
MGSHFPAISSGRTVMADGVDAGDGWGGPGRRMGWTRETDVMAAESDVMYSTA